MSMTDPITTLHGSCHCGQLNITFSTSKNPAEINPRSCDCSFCRKHGAAYISDPNGKLWIVQSHPGALREYRQGSNAAKFLLCSACGVLIGVVYEHSSSLYGVINTGCLDGETGLSDALPASPQLLSADEKVSRWLSLWVPNVAVVTRNA
jgi:hypothetical protein